MPSATRESLEAELEAVEKRLVAEPASTDLLALRARLLFELGDVERARQQYIAILKRDRRHYSTLNNFGVLLHKMGQMAAAGQAYRAAIALEPNNPIAHTNLGDLLVHEGDLATARAHYEIALRIDPACLNAHRGLGVVFWAIGNAERSRHHQQQQYQGRALATLPYLGTGEPTPILVLTSAGLGNLPWPDLIDNSVFSITTLAVEFYDREVPLPPHCLIFNAIGDADVCRGALESAGALLERTSAQVINRPAAVLATDRVANSARLRHVPGVVTPRSVALSRQRLMGPDAHAAVDANGFSFPLLLRSGGFHMGQHFVRVDSPDALAGAAAQLPGDELLAIEYLDARADDGKVRKYRVISIDGRLYPLHLAVSEHWKVHYFSAAMPGQPAHQAEEGAFLNDMTSVLGPNSLRALEKIAEVTGLDYAGIDFGLGCDGQVLLFEANATMRIQPPGPEPQWDYRRASVSRALNAARSMLLGRAGVSKTARRAA